MEMILRQIEEAKDVLLKDIGASADSVKTERLNEAFERFSAECSKENVKQALLGFPIDWLVMTGKMKQCGDYRRMVDALNLLLYAATGYKEYVGNAKYLIYAFAKICSGVRSRSDVASGYPYFEKEFNFANFFGVEMYSREMFNQENEMHKVGLYALTGKYCVFDILGMTKSLEPFHKRLEGFLIVSSPTTQRLRALIEKDAGVLLVPVR